MSLANAHVEGRVEGAARKGLSRKQNNSLIALALSAFAQEFPPTEESFDVWRHRQTMLAVERSGFRACTNDDYLTLKQHFLKLSGREAEAIEAGQRAETDGQRRPLHVLEQACSECADVMPDARSYALGILRKRGMDFENADPKALYRAMYTVRRRATQLRGITA